ncbi:MAG TPA: PPOX class F420-dependent oxidoreductase [Patescibacteria group bacterium]|nr:PPOX class F420-dependent oxidoreductase [Patescibacteria group bacterium]
MQESIFPTQLETFFTDPHFMTLGTLRNDGSIQMSVVWYEYVHGVFKVSTTSERAKYKNISRDYRVTFVVMDKNNPYRYIQVRGNTTIDRQDAHDLIDRLSLRYTGNTPYQGDPQHKEDRVVITITPSDFTTMGFD